MGPLSDTRKQKDNDLAKIQIRWPLGFDPKQLKIDLKARGVGVGYPEFEGKISDFPVIVTSGKTRLRFYDKSGEIIEYSNKTESNLLSADSEMSNEMKNDGIAVAFIDGGYQFGMIEPELTPKSGEYGKKTLQAAEESAQIKGGELLEFHIEYSGRHITQSVLINKGGFWRYVIPKTKAPLPEKGVLGSLEFRDGRGRMGAAGIDLGKNIASFNARSGVTNGAAADVVGGKGHAPKGWYLVYKRTDFSGRQRDIIDGSGEESDIRQGGYVRWMQDDATDAAQRYKEDFVYNGSLRHDRSVGLPTRIMYKWQMHPIAPDDADGRSQLQIHPDGRKNGTLGCIGIQNYSDCVRVSTMLSNYSQNYLYVEIQQPTKK